MSEIDVFTIDLSNIYELSPEASATTILKKILENYKVRFKVVWGISPDVGDIIKEKDFEKYIDHRKHPLECVAEYAKDKGADAVVELRDGYELAYAVVWYE